MGTLRLLLALCVVVAHAAPLPGIHTLDAGLAVKTFFMISGFYMALILAEKYPAGAEGRRLFYTNRLLRIYPMYLITLTFAVLFYAAASVHLGRPADRLQFWSDAGRHGHWGGLALVAVSQLSVIGLDVTPLFGYSAAQGFHLLGATEISGDIPAWRLNFLPHCWSIGAELLFYAAAPWLAGLRTRGQAALLVASGVLVWAAEWSPGLLSSMATYHLGLLQLPYFVLGMLTYRLLKGSALFRPTSLRAAPPAALLLALTFSGWPQLGKPSGYLYLLGAWLVIPMLFSATRDSGADRWTGELSYPIYLLHVPVKWSLLAARGVAAKDAAEVPGWMLTLATLVAAGLIVVLVDRPMERFRRRRFERRAAPVIDVPRAKS